MTSPSLSLPPKRGELAVEVQQFLTLGVADDDVAFAAAT